MNFFTYFSYIYIVKVFQSQKKFASSISVDYTPGTSYYSIGVSAPVHDNKIYRPATGSKPLANDSTWPM